MYTNDFESAFSNFLKCRDYDDAVNDLFAVVRLAFRAGWLAAGGTPPVPQRIFELIRTTSDSDSDCSD